MAGISIVILTFNSKEFVKTCLDSVSAQDYQDCEIIIVDNGSGDGTQNFIKENYPQISLIENGENVGAAKARNQGISIAKGEWILVLDCDTILNNNFLFEISKVLRNCSLKVGMIQPKILRGDRKTIYSCGIHLSWFRRFYDIGYGKLDNNQFDNLKYTFGACSAAAVYRRSMLEDIKAVTGYFDENFFFLVEDVDLSWRAQRKGWKTIVHAKAICCHCGNSSHVDLRIRQYLCFKNRFSLIFKNEGRVNYIKKIFPLLFYDLPRLGYLYLTNSYVREDTYKKLSRWLRYRTR